MIEAWCLKQVRPIDCDSPVGSGQMNVQRSGKYSASQNAMFARRSMLSCLAHYDLPLDNLQSFLRRLTLRAPRDDHVEIHLHHEGEIVEQKMFVRPVWIKTAARAE